MIARLRACVLALVLALVLASAAPDAASASSPPACPPGGVCDRDSTHESLVRRARTAQRDGAWNEAAELWSDALSLDDGVAEHWSAMAHVLTRAGRDREAVAAHQRAIQLDAGRLADGTWSIARAYARLGNDRQALRWLELALRGGLAGHEREWREPVFDRYRDDVRFRRLIEAGRLVPAHMRGNAGTSWS